MGRYSTPSMAASIRRRPTASTCSTTARRSDCLLTESLVAVDSPGHAKHHLGLHDSRSGVLFAGDAVGVKLPDAGVLRPSTPPPEFDLDQALHSLERFAARRPTALALAHYGVIPEPAGLLAEATETLRRWAEVAETAFRQGEDIAAALATAFAGDLEGVPEEHKEKLEVMNGVHSNAAGLHRWLATRQSGARLSPRPGRRRGRSRPPSRRAAAVGARRSRR